MRANPTTRATHECEILDGQGMRVLPRQLPVGVAHLPFSGYHGLISRAPTRRPAGTPGWGPRRGRISGQFNSWRVAATEWPAGFPLQT